MEIWLVVCLLAVLPVREIGGGMSGGALLTLTDMYKMHGQPADSMIKNVAVKASPHKDPLNPQPARGSAINGPVGGSKPKGNRAPSERNVLVKKIMAEQKLSLPQASKYISEHKLYKKKGEH
jgi:hypothetical protein